MLRALVDGVEVACIPPPVSVAPRAWVLGVIAVQAAVEDGRVVARLRWSRTGAEASLRDLPARVVVHAGLGDLGAPPTIAIPELRGASARLALFVDGIEVEAGELRPGDLAREPVPRAFAHVFCRWLRDGSVEHGCDVTGFQSLPEGEKFERLAVKTLRAGAVVSIAYAAASR